MQKISMLILLQISNFQAVKIEIPLVIRKKCYYIRNFCILCLFWEFLFTQHNFSPRQQLVRHPTLPRQYRRRSLRPRQRGTSPQPRGA
jgi:hypothetical protein